MRVVQQSNILLILIISFTLNFILILENQVFGIEYTNYTSEEHEFNFNILRIGK